MAGAWLDAIVKTLSVNGPRRRGPFAGERAGDHTFIADHDYHRTQRLDPA